MGVVHLRTCQSNPPHTIAMTAQTLSSYVKTRFPLAQVLPLEDPASSGTQAEAKATRVLKQVKSLHIKRNLLSANKSSQMFIGTQSMETDDPFGSVLRKLRIQQGLDPSEVAAYACITVWQLYELETGKDALFYTPGLRKRAAERVASFLKSDWAAICEGRVTVRTLQETPVQLHLIASRRQAHPAHPPMGPQTVQDAPEIIDMTEPDDAPLSLAQLLRVADATGRSVP